MKHCPDCNREMTPATARTPEDVWKCEYCKVIWISATLEEIGKERKHQEL